MFRVHKSWGPIMYLLVCLFLVAGVASHANGSDSSPGMLGVTLRDAEGRVLVSDVYVDGPAYVAGLRPGDRIIAVGHKAVNTSTELREVLAENRANERIEVYASRDGWMKDLPITLVNREALVGKRLLVASQAPPPRARSVPVSPSRPIVHPDPAHRLRYERW